MTINRKTKILSFLIATAITAVVTQLFRSRQKLIGN